MKMKHEQEDEKKTPNQNPIFREDKPRTFAGLNRLNTIKVSCPENEKVEEIVGSLKRTLQCEVTSPIMWSNEQHLFYVYLSVA